MKNKFLLILALILTDGIALAQDNRVLTFDEAKQLADQGDAYGEAIVAFHYSVGWQTEKNLELAAKYAISSTQKGHPLGAFRLGALLRSGDGVPKNEAQGIDLQSKAISGLDQIRLGKSPLKGYDNPYAITALGVALFQGKVLQEDKQKAALFYKGAADVGFAPAEFNYAMCAIAGHGIEKDLDSAINYISRAALQGYPPALTELKKIHLEFSGVINESLHELEKERRVIANNKYKDVLDNLSEVDHDFLKNQRIYLDKLLSSEVEPDIRLRIFKLNSWIDALDGLEGYASLDSVGQIQSVPTYQTIRINYSGRLVTPTIAQTFNATCAKFIEDKKQAFIGSDSGILACYDTDTGGEIWRGHLPGKVEVIFEFGQNVYAQVRTPPTEWMHAAQIWLIEPEHEKMTRLPVMIDSGQESMHINNLVGYIPSSDELVFLAKMRACLYAMNPKTMKTRILTFIGDSGYNNDIRNFSVIVEAGIFRFGQSPYHFNNLMLSRNNISRLGIATFEDPPKINTSEQKRIFDISEKLSLAITSRQSAQQIYSDRYVDKSEWNGDPTPELLTYTKGEFGKASRIRFTTDEKKSEKYPDFLEKWLPVESELSEAPYSQFSDYIDKTVQVQQGSAEAAEGFGYSAGFGYTHIPYSRNCWLAFKDGALIGNFDGDVSNTTRNELFIGSILDDNNLISGKKIAQLPNNYLLMPDGMFAKITIPKNMWEYVYDERPISMGILSNELSFYSIPQGIVFYRKVNSNWEGLSPQIPKGCSSGLHNFRKTQSGEFLLADAAGWTHFIKHIDSEPFLHAPFRIRVKNQRSYVVLWNDNLFMASSDQISDLFFSFEYRAHPFEQFDLRLNRPDIVLERLDAPEEAIAIAKQLREKRLKRMGVTEDMLQPDFHLPEIEIVGDLPSSTGESELALKIKASDSKYPLDRLRLYVNNVPVNGKEGELLRDAKSQSLERTIPIKLAAGRNKIQVSVLNSAGAESLYANAEVTCTAQRPKPTLYAVAMGVSEYANPDWNLKYAAKDARDILERLKARSDSSYGEIKELLLTDRGVTKESLGKIREFLSKATVDDTVLLFVAGHGLLDSKYDYYFGTSDIDFNNPSENGIAFEEFDDLLAELPCLRKSLLIDTCHAGELDEDEKKMLAGGQANPNQVVAMLPTGARGMTIKPIEGARGKSEWYDRLQGLFVDLRRGSGSTILSSSAGAEYALESSEQKNGLFTYAVLEALDGKEGSDANKDGSVTMSELADYVKTRVAALTNNKQSPNVRRVNLEGDFALAKK